MSTPIKKEIISCSIQFEWTLQDTVKHRRPDNDTVLPWLLINYVLLASSVYRNWLKATFINLLRLRMPFVCPLFGDQHSTCCSQRDQAISVYVIFENYMLSFLYCFISITVQFLLFRMTLGYLRRIRHSQILNSFH